MHIIRFRNNTPNLTDASDLIMDMAAGLPWETKEDGTVVATTPHNVVIEGVPVDLDTYKQADIAGLMFAPDEAGWVNDKKFMAVNIKKAEN